MADPKYANLPGIAHDQPDVYETTNELLLPEADQRPRDDLASNSVETLHVSAGEALGRFRGKHLDTRNADFSDRIHEKKGLNMKGYAVWSDETAELYARGVDPEETPMQKYRRINAEVRELLRELNEAAENKDSAGDKVKDEGELTQVVVKVKGLQKDLSDIKLEETLGKVIHSFFH